MSRVAVPAAVVVLALLAAGCGNSGENSALTTSVRRPTARATCRLTRAQRHSVARVLADIRRLRRIEAPIQTYSEHGAPNEVNLTGKVEVDLGSTHLPPNLFSHLLHLAKTATRLCGDCGMALEAEEPVLGNRAGAAHGACG